MGNIGIRINGEWVDLMSAFVPCQLCNEPVQIKNLVDALVDVSGWSGSVTFDKTVAEGTLAKLLDVRRINQLGWTAQINIYGGLECTWNWLNSAHGKGDIRV